MSSHVHLHPHPFVLTDTACCNELHNWRQNPDILEQNRGGDLR
jgi:hypothetical protein